MMMSRIPSKADPYCDAEQCHNCKGILTAIRVTDDYIQYVCTNGDCSLSEGVHLSETSWRIPSLKMNGVHQYISALSAIAYTRVKDPAELKKMARDALANVPVGIAGTDGASSVVQVISGIDALLDDDQVITLRKQDGEFVAHIKRNGKALWTTDKKSWLFCVLGVALAWASDGQIGVSE